VHDLPRHINEADGYVFTNLLLSPGDRINSAACLHVPREPSKASTVSSQKKRHACLEDGCGKEYATRHHLRSHADTHTGQKRYKCNNAGCEMDFTWVSTETLEIPNFLNQAVFRSLEPS